MARGNERREIFRDDDDRQRFLRLAAKMVDRHHLRIHAYALMPNHYHLLVETPQAGLSSALHWLNGTYSQYFNRRHGRVGHLFQGRFKSILVQEERYFMKLSRYIHQNPVQAKLSEQPWDYAWSSCRDFLGMRVAPNWLDTKRTLGFFKDNSRLEYKTFLQETPENDPLKHAVANAMLGDDDFMETIRSKISPNIQNNKEISHRMELRRKYSVLAIQNAIKELGFPTDESSKRRWSRCPGQGLGMYFLQEHAGLRQSEIAVLYGVTRAAVTRRIAKIKSRMLNEKQIALTVTAIERCLVTKHHFSRADPNVTS